MSSERGSYNPVRTNRNNNHLETNSKMYQRNTITSDLTMDDPVELIEFKFVDRDGKITKESLKAALKPPYPVKYYVNVLLFMTVLTVFLLWNFGVIPGPQIGFFCNDQLFSHKYTGDTVTPTMLLLGVVLLPISIYFIDEYARQGRFKKIFEQQNLLEFYLYFKQYAIGSLLVGGFAEIAKTIVGEHRPHFFDTCMPDTNLNCTTGTYIFTYTCTNRDVAYLDIIDASRSFPSGHSSFGWFCALYSAYVVYTRLQVKRTGTLLKVLLLLLCLTFGMVSSLTRITDRRHHWWDVLIGTIIGVVGAVLSVRITQHQTNMLREQTRTSENKIRREASEMELEFSV